MIQVLTWNCTVVTEMIKVLTWNCLLVRDDSSTHLELHVGERGHSSTHLELHVGEGDEPQEELASRADGRVFGCSSRQGLNAAVSAVLKLRDGFHCHRHTKMLNITFIVLFYY